MLSSGITYKRIGKKWDIEYEGEVKRSIIPFCQCSPHVVPLSHPALVPMLLCPFAYRETCGPDYIWGWKWPYYLQADHRSEGNSWGCCRRSRWTRDCAAREPRGVSVTVTTLGMTWQSKSFSLPVRELSLSSFFLTLTLTLVFGAGPSGFLRARVLQGEGVTLFCKTPVFASLLSPLSVWPNKTSKSECFSLPSHLLLFCLEGLLVRLS